MQGTRELRNRTIAVQPNTRPKKKLKSEDQQPSNQHEDANSGSVPPRGDDIPEPGRRKRGRAAPKKTKTKKNPPVKRRRKSSIDEEKILELLNASPPLEAGNEHEGPVPPRLRESVRIAHGKGGFSVGMVRHFHNLGRGDLLRRVPGTGGPNSVLEDLFGEDAREAERINGTNKEASGWRKENLGYGAYGKFHLWEKTRRVGPPIRIVSKDASRIDGIYQDHNFEGNSIRRLNDAGCKNVIKVLDWFPVKQKFCNWFEYAEFRGLRELVLWYKREGLVLPEAFLWHVFYSMANALCYCRHGTNVLHTCNPRPHWDRIIHNYLDHDNILLTAPDEDCHRLYPCLKLNDFGHSYTLGEPRLELQRWRSKWYDSTKGDEFAASEIANKVPSDRLPWPGETQDSYSDVYSLGVVMAQMCKLADRRLGEPLRKLLIHGGTANPSGRRIFSYYYTPELKELIRRCRSLNPLERPPIFSLYLEAKTGMETFRDRTYKDLQESPPPLIADVPIYHDKVLFTTEEKSLWADNDEFQEAYMDANLDPVLEADFPLVTRKRHVKRKCEEMLSAIDDSIVTDQPSSRDHDSSDVSADLNPQSESESDSESDSESGGESGGSAAGDDRSSASNRSVVLPSIE